MRQALLLLVACPLAAAALACFGAGVSVAGDPQVKERTKPRLTSKQKARVELGRRLFFDPAASPSGARSCASCHSPDHGWSDPARVSADDVGDTRRHSQTILDAAFHANAHWDGEFDSVEALVVARLGTDPRERTPGGGYGGHRSLTPRGRKAPQPTPVTPGERRPFVDQVLEPHGASQLVVERLRAGGRYAPAFRAAFGDKKLTLGRIAIAIGMFTQSVESTTSPYDRYMAGELDAISASAKRGLELFNGRAGCNQCHTSGGAHAFFTDFAFHNTAVAHHELSHLDFEGDSEAALRRRLMRKALRGREGKVDPEQLAQLLDVRDRGRGLRTGKAKDDRTFKTPTLRDVAKRGPYMHSGRFETLAEVVAYYAGGCGPDPHKSRKLRAFPCSEQDTADLVAFLESLSGTQRPGLATEVWAQRARKTKLTFVDAAGLPMKGLDVKLVPVGDVVPSRSKASEDALALTTNRQGQLRYAPGARTHMRVVLPEGVPVLDGDLVPDSCKGAAVRVPVAGRMTFVITFGARESPPAQLVGIHPTHEPLIGHPRARTIFTRIGEAVDTKDGRVAKYEGWARTDVGSAVKLLIPGRIEAEREGGGRREMVYAISGGAEYRLDARSGS